jgi:hypothetical protein
MPAAKAAAYTLRSHNRAGEPAARDHHFGIDRLVPRRTEISGNEPLECLPMQTFWSATARSRPF